MSARRVKCMTLCRQVCFLRIRALRRQVSFVASPRRLLECARTARIKKVLHRPRVAGLGVNLTYRWGITTFSVLYLKGEHVVSCPHVRKAWRGQLPKRKKSPLEFVPNQFQIAVSQNAFPASDCDKKSVDAPLMNHNGSQTHFTIFVSSGGVPVDKLFVATRCAGCAEVSRLSPHQRAGCSCAGGSTLHDVPQDGSL